MLVITLAFPPVGGVPGQGLAKFAKYFPSFEWNPVILTLRKDSHGEIFMSLDYSLCSDIPKNTVIYEAQDLVEPTDYQKDKDVIIDIIMKNIGEGS